MEPLRLIRRRIMRNRLFGQLAEVQHMPFERGMVWRLRLQCSAAVLAYRLQHSVSQLVTGLVRNYERFVDQRGEQIQYIPLIDTLPLADVLCRLQRPAAGKDRESAKQRALK